MVYCHLIPPRFMSRNNQLWMILNLVLIIPKLDVKNHLIMDNYYFCDFV